jgi:hypothetical protein
MLMTGFVLHKGKFHERVSCLAIQEFLDQVLSVSIHINTTRLYCDADGVFNMVAKVRSASQAQMSAHQLVDLGLEYIEKLSAAVFYQVHSNRIYCMDVATTTRRFTTV